MPAHAVAPCKLTHLFLFAISLKQHRLSDLIKKYFTIERNLCLLPQLLCLGELRVHGDSRSKLIGSPDRDKITFVQVPEYFDQAA